MEPGRFSTRIRSSIAVTKIITENLITEINPNDKRIVEKL
jgi:hypothetical protein